MTCLSFSISDLYACLKSECPLTRTVRPKSIVQMLYKTQPLPLPQIDSFLQRRQLGWQLSFGRRSASLTKELKEQVLGHI